MCGVVVSGELYEGGDGEVVRMVSRANGVGMMQMVMVLVQCMVCLDCPIFPNF